MLRIGRRHEKPCAKAGGGVLQPTVTVGTVLLQFGDTTANSLIGETVDYATANEWPTRCRPDLVQKALPSIPGKHG